METFAQAEIYQWVKSEGVTMEPSTSLCTELQCHSISILQEEIQQVTENKNVIHRWQKANSTAPGSLSNQKFIYMCDKSSTSELLAGMIWLAPIILRPWMPSVWLPRGLLPWTETKSTSCISPTSLGKQWLSFPTQQRESKYLWGILHFAAEVRAQSCWQLNGRLPDFLMIGNIHFLPWLLKNFPFVLLHKKLTKFCFSIGLHVVLLAACNKTDQTANMYSFQESSELLSVWNYKIA